MSPGKKDMRRRLPLLLFFTLSGRASLGRKSLQRSDPRVKLVLQDYVICNISCMKGAM